MSESEWTAAVRVEPVLDFFATCARQAGENSRAIGGRRWWPGHRSWQKDCKSVCDEHAINFDSVRGYLTGVHNQAYEGKT